jgi:arylsulfatase A-like enzyme
LKSRKDAGVLNNTLVLFTSDNGPFWGAHFLRGKNAPYEEAIHVPFAVRFPRLIPRTARVDSTHIIANIDIAPTIYDLMEQPIPEQVTGKSLLPLLLDQKTKWRKELFFEGWPDKPGDIGDPNQCRPPFRAIRNSRYIYIEYEKNTGTGAPCIFETRDGPELYDLTLDPFQLNNLAGNVGYARVQSKLSERLKAFPKVEAPLKNRDEQ